MQRLSDLKYEAEWRVPLRKGGHRTFGLHRWSNDHLFDVAMLESQQFDLWGGSDTRVSIRWSVRPGQWAKFWFNADEGPWIAQCARQLLRLDHRENRAQQVTAKKTGLYLTLLPTASRGATVEIFVQTLLDHIGEITPELHSHPGRVRDRFESGLDILAGGNFLHWEWADGAGDGSPDRKKGWTEHWLNRKLRITLCTAPNVLLKDVPKRPPHTTKLRRMPSFDGEVLRHLRKEAKLTQADVGRAVGVSPVVVSYFENGKRRPSPAILERLKCLPWFSAPSPTLEFGASPCTVSSCT